MKLHNLMAGLIVIGCACAQNPLSSEDSSAPLDVEAAYLVLSSAVQVEVLGIDARPTASVRRDLLAKADKDGDGKLSDQEKAELRARWKDMKETLRAELKAALDKDQDGSISQEEKKAALEHFGQEIKAAIQETLADLHAAQKEAREKIRAACRAPRDGKDSSHGHAAEDQPADELDVESAQQDMENELTACQAAVEAEKDKIHAALKNAWDTLHAELDKLKEKLGALDDAQAQ